MPKNKQQSQVVIQVMPAPVAPVATQPTLPPVEPDFAVKRHYVETSTDLSDFNVLSKTDGATYPSDIITHGGKYYALSRRLRTHEIANDFSKVIGATVANDYVNNSSGVYGTFQADISNEHNLIAFACWDKHCVQIAILSDWLNGTLTVIDTIGEWGKAGNIADGKLQNPCRVKFKQNGNLVVTCYKGKAVGATKLGNVTEWTKEAVFVATRYAPNGEADITNAGLAYSRAVAISDDETQAIIGSYESNLLILVDILPDGTWVENRLITSIAGLPVASTDVRALSVDAIPESEGGGWILYLRNQPQPIHRMIVKLNKAIECINWTGAYERRKEAILPEGKDFKDNPLAIKQAWGLRYLGNDKIAIIDHDGQEFQFARFPDEIIDNVPTYHFSISAIPSNLYGYRVAKAIVAGVQVEAQNVDLTNKVVKIGMWHFDDMNWNDNKLTILMEK